MVRNATFVEQNLANTQIGKKAEHGFDLSLKEVKVMLGSGVVHKNKTDTPEYVLITPNEEGYYELPMGIYSITFNEGGRVPENHCGWIKSRSSMIRNGVSVESGLYDTGFECQTFGAVMFVHNSVKIEQNARVAQFLLFESEEAEAYDGQYLGSKDRK